MQSNNKTIEELNIIIDKIKKDQQKYNTKNFNISIISLIEYYQTDTFKNDLKLATLDEKFSILTNPIKNDGTYYPEDNNILIYLNIFNKNIIKPFDFINTVQTILHEIRHHQQHNLKKELYNDYDNFIFFMENLSRNFNNTFYKKYYKKIYSEIDADHYSIHELEKYIDPNDIKTKKYINHYKKIYTYKLYTYDPEYLFKEFNNSLINDENFYLAITLHPYFKLFYNKDKSFKTPSQISRDINIYKRDLNPKILSTIIGSDTYLRTINIDTLSLEEINFLIPILINKYNDIKKQKEISSNFFQENISIIKEIIHQDINLKEKIKLLTLKSTNYDINTIWKLLIKEYDIKLNYLLSLLEKMDDKKIYIPKTKKIYQFKL